MKCPVQLIFVLLLATNSFADSSVSASAPIPCGEALAAHQTVQFHQSAAEIVRPLKRPNPIIPLGCDRPFTYQGEVYSVDPPQVQDASTLKYFVRSVPESESLLNEYQENRKRRNFSVYTGTAGILLFALSSRLAPVINKDHPETIQAVMRAAGFVLAAGGVAYSISLSRANEALIPRAVKSFNQAKPNDPIELKFSTSWNF